MIGNFIFSISDVGVNIGFFSTSSILLFIIPTIYYLYKKNLFLFLITYFSLVLTGSRAGFVICTLAFLIWIVKHIYDSFFKRIDKFNPYFFIICLTLTYLCINTEYFRGLVFLVDKIVYSEKFYNSFSIRYEYIKYYFDHISLHMFIFGYGNNYSIFNSYREIFDKTEISQLNYLYKNGFLNSLLLLCVSIRVIFKNLKNKSYKILSESNIKIFSFIFIFIYLSSLSQEFLLHPINVLILIFITFNERQIEVNKLQKT